MFVINSIFSVRILRKRIENLEDMQKLLISRIEQLEQLPTLPLSTPSTSQPHNFLEQDFIQVVCNTSQLKSLKLKCLIRIDTYHIECLALIDSGCSNCIINKALVPDQFIVKSPNPVSAQQMDGTSHLYGELLPPNTKIRFVTNCDLSQEYTLLINSIYKIQPTSTSLRNYTEPLDFSITKDIVTTGTQTKILFCNHCDSMQKNFLLLNTDNQNLHKEKSVLQQQISKLNLKRNCVYAF